MTISETIAYLEKLKEEKGDVKIEFGNDSTDSSSPIDGLVRFVENNNSIILGVIV